ncbi:MAG: tetratricopeptide repeat protein [Xanthomonadales bacterium]|nr:tetratricopeptide repeat protein [Xanthomonadales bacterium]
MIAHAVELSEGQFQAGVIEESEKRPVLVDFWAPWCAPCRALTPVLEKLAEEFAGQFLLAKVNSDEYQALAGQYGVRGIPNVKAFYGGKIVDEFTGALPEGQVREFIHRLIPSEGEKQRQAAMDIFAAGEPERALALLEAAQMLEADNDHIRLDRIEVLLSQRRAAEAAELFDELAPLTRMEDRAQHLQAELTFADPGDGEDPAELESRVADNPGDLDARLRLARHYVNTNQYEPALQQLLEVIRADRSFGDDAGRKTMLAVFELLGSGHELTRRYRRLLATALN